MPAKNVIDTRRHIEGRFIFLDKQPLEFSPIDFALEESATKGDNVYEKLGNFAFRVFARTYVNYSRGRTDVANKLGSDSSATGFMLVSRLLACAPRDYKTYCARNRKRPVLDEMSEGLKRSGATPLTLMNMPNWQNKRMEYALGLRDRNKDACQALEFSYTERGLEYKFKAFDLRAARISAAQEAYGPREGEESELPKYMQYCPAQAYVVEKVWPALIDLASQVPQAFPADLQLQL